MILTTPRLVLRPFRDVDRSPFFALNTHPAVVDSLGSAPSRAESDAMIERYGAELAREGWGLWTVEVPGDTTFAGMVGLHRVRPELPCAPAVEIGWRLHPDHWGHGYASEAASASLRFGFEQAGLEEIVAFTTDAEHALAGRHGAHRHGARPGRGLRPPLGARGQPAAAPRALPGQPDVPGVTRRPYGGTMSKGDGAGGGVSRCPWVGSDPEMVAYHDTEWGVPVHDDPTHFEFLVLEGAQAGLSWSTILKRRAGYRKAFAGFEPAKVARFTPARIEKLLADPGIIRNRAKVGSAVRNARTFVAVQKEFGSFDAYIWGFVGGRPVVNKWRRVAQVPPISAESEALSKDLKRRGFSFVGPTVCYAHLQATGLVNDHLVSCFRYSELTGSGT